MPKHNKTRIPHHFGVKVIKDTYSQVTRHANSDDQWDRDCTDSSHYINGIKLTEHGHEADVLVDFLPTIGEEYYLVYANYQTGDSFGHDSGNIFFIDLVKNQEVANRIEKHFREHDEKHHDYDKKSNVTYKRESGNIAQIHVPWGGYFEILEGVHVQRVKMEG